MINTLTLIVWYEAEVIALWEDEEFEEEVEDEEELEDEEEVEDEDVSLSIINI